MRKRVSKMSKKPNTTPKKKKLTKAEVMALQQLLTEKHKAVLQLIVIISNQLIRQDLLVDILTKSKYCTNEVAVSKLLKDLEDAKLIKRVRMKYSRCKIVQIKRAGLNFILGDKAIPLKKSKNGEIMLLLRICKVELFRLHYIRNGYILEEAINEALSDNSNLFKDTQFIYDFLRKDRLAYDSFHTKSSTFYRQEDEIKRRLKEAQKHLDEVRRLKKKDDEEEGKQKELYEVRKRCWTFEDLKTRNIFVSNMYLREPSQESLDDWIDRHYAFHMIENNFKPETLVLEFDQLTISSTPDIRALLKSIMNIVIFIKKSFKMHDSFFQEDKKIKRAIVEIDCTINVRFINKNVLNSVDLAKAMKIFEKRLDKYMMGRDFKYKFKLNFDHLNVKNEYKYDKRKKSLSSK